MDREIIWSVWASDDLVSIAEHISRDSESYAATVVRELVAAARSLRVFADGVGGFLNTMTRRFASFSSASIGSFTAFTLGGSTC
jgi:plasmid stabilization system protein ParE